MRQVAAGSTDDAPATPGAGQAPALSVAPMEGLTPFPTRLWLALASQPESMTTPFLRVTSREPDGALPRWFAPELFELRGALPYELTPQFMAPDPEHMLRAAELVPPEVAAMIELNCGCPSPNGAGARAGSGVLAEPEFFGAMLARLSRHLGPGRLAVKMRIGIAAPDELPALVPHVASLPLGRLTVHGRTRKEGYRGRSRWELIETVAASAAAPTWASGDVVDAATFAALRSAAPAAAGVMIGRGALRNPWVFSELRSGAAVRLTPEALAQALFCFALLQDLWTTVPEKLIARVASGRLGAPVGTDAEAWERVAAMLTGMRGGRSFILTRNTDGPLGLSPTAAARLRTVWSYMRSAVSEELAGARLMRARAPEDFFSLILGERRGASPPLRFNPSAPASTRPDLSK